MGAIVRNVVNDQLLRLSYKDPKNIKRFLRNWGGLDGLSEKGDTVATCILTDLKTVTAIDLDKYHKSDRAEFNKAYRKGKLSHYQYMSIAYDFESKQTIKLPKEEWVYVENALPPIVTQEEWDLICKIHEERVIATGSDKRGKKTSGYSFSGKLVCGICGAPYWRKQRVSKDEYWVCSTKQTKGRRTRKRDSTMGKAGEINPLGCDNENISYNSLMEIMGVVSERLQANTDTIKQDMINWLTKLRKQLLEANGGHTEADLQREISRKSKLLDAYLDGILNKQEYQKKAEELDERIIQLKAETEKNKANSGDIAEIDKVLANIDEEVARYVDGNEKLKVEYLLEHLEQVQIFPDKVIVIVPILSEGIVVEKTQYVSREKWRREKYLAAYAFWRVETRQREDLHR